MERGLKNKMFIKPAPAGFLFTKVGKQSIFCVLHRQIRSRRSTDRTKVCGTLNPGSIPGGITNKKSGLLPAFYFVRQKQVYLKS